MTDQPVPPPLHAQAFEALNHSPLTGVPTPEQRTRLAAIIDEMQVRPDDTEVYLRPHIQSSGAVIVLLGARLTYSPSGDAQQDFATGVLEERVVELYPDGRPYNDYRVKTEDI